MSSEYRIGQPFGARKTHVFDDDMVCECGSWMYGNGVDVDTGDYDDGEAIVEQHRVSKTCARKAGLIE